MSLSYFANLAEIFAGLAILFSVIKVWPALGNLNQLVKREKDWHLQLATIQTGIARYTGDPCPVLPNVHAAANHILTVAVSSGSSDIHVEIKALDDVIQGCVRFRCDAQLETVCFYDVKLHTDLLSAFKELSNLPNEQTLGPTLGRIRFDMGDSPIDFRYQLTPARLGEFLHLRVLDSSSASMPYSALGIGKRELDKVKQRLSSPHGLMVFGGATGSGKTVSFYTSIKHMDDQSLIIIAIEDPVEVEIPSIVQMEVQDRPGHSLADMMRAAMRSDPDVLVIGEIEGPESAGYCFRAAATGHLVVSVIHSNDVIRSLENLHKYSNDGLFTEITLMNQWLGRRLCSHCSMPTTKSTADNELIDSILKFNRKHRNDLIEDNFRSPVGCEQCAQGYKGRVGGYEVLEVSGNLIETLSRNGDRAELWSIALDSGTQTIAYDLLQKAAQGLTSLDEIRRLGKLN